MPRDFYPRREADIVNWTANFSGQINLAPHDYGLTAAQASDYAALQQAFSGAYAIVRCPATNSSSAVVAKEIARIALEAGTRLLAGINKAQPAVTDDMRVDLGLPPRPVRRRHVPPPDSAPILRVVGSSGNAIHVRLTDATSTRLGKPRDVRGAAVFGCVSEHPPTRPDQWHLKAITSRATTQVRFDATLPPGTKVWLSAYWTNPREEKGPSCPPVYTHLHYGLAPLPALIRRAA